MLVSGRTPTHGTLSCHPGLEPGSIGPTLERLRNGSRLEAGMTVGGAEEAE